MRARVKRSHDRLRHLRARAASSPFALSADRARFFACYAARALNTPALSSSAFFIALALASAPSALADSEDDGAAQQGPPRSEERRAGKGTGSRWAPRPCRRTR